MIVGVTRRGSSQLFVGRRVELDRLKDAFERATQGRPSLVLVAGEAGVGKSRLVAEFSMLVDRSDGIAVTGACLDLGGGGLPYAPFVEALRALARDLDPDARDAAFGPSGEVLRGLVPDLRDPDARPEREDQPEATGRLARLFDAVIATLGRLSHARPLALILEDVHWADGSTRDLIRFLVRNVRDERLLVIATYRSDDLHRRHPMMPLLTELERADNVEGLELRRFDRDELREQLGSILQAPPTSEYVDALMERSDGLPFYVEELVAGAEQVDSYLPSTLRNVLERRLASLSPESLSLVRAAAVIGGRFEHARLVAASRMDEDALIPALREAMDARIVIPIEDRDGPAYAFRHTLLREAAYDDLLPAERVRLHERIADDLEATIRAQRLPDASILGDFARHAYHAHDQPRALVGSVRALKAFIDTVAYREALDQAERALELWPRVENASERAGIDHVDLLALAGRMASAANRPERAMALTQEAIDELEARGENDRRTALLVDLQLCAWEARAFDVSSAAAERAYALAASGAATPIRASVTLGMAWARWWQGRIGEAAQLLEDAMAIADAMGDRAVWADAAASLAHTRSDLGEGTRASLLVDLSSEAVPDDDLRFDRIMAEVDRSIAALNCGRFADAERFASTGLDFSSRYGWADRFGPGFRGAILDALLELGRFGEAEAIARPVLAGSGIHHTIVWVRTTMARIAVAQGRLEDAHRLVDEMEWLGAAWSEEAYQRIGDIDLARAEGRFADVVTYVDQVLTSRNEREAVSALWSLLGLAIGACADQAVRARRRRTLDESVAACAHAERWLALFRELIDRPRVEGGAGPWIEALLATAEADMSRALDDPDPGAWAAVSTLWVALSQPFQTAYAGLRLTEAILQSTGERKAAEMALRAAHEIATGIGANPLRGAP